MDNFSFNKHVLQPPRSSNNSVLDEIRAKDIYTVNSPEFCPTLPSLARTLSTSYHQTGSNESAVTVDNLNNVSPENLSKLLNSSGMVDSLYVVFEDGLINNSEKPKMKRLSIGTYQNLPAVMEEDIDPLDSPLHERPEEQINLNAIPSNNSAVGEAVSYSKLASDDEEDFGDYLYSPNEDYYANYTLGDCVNQEESWVDLSRNLRTPPLAPVHSSNMTSPTSPQTFYNGDEYLRLLREAQKESNQSSARVSLASSRRDSPRDTPRSPPNSPNTEIVLEPEEAPVKEVLINYYNTEGDFIRVEKKLETDWLWNWSSRPDQQPPKDWNFSHDEDEIIAKRGISLRKLTVGNSSIFSRDVLYTLLITNVLSLLLGTGIGIWLSKKSGSTVTISTMPLN